MYSPEFLAVVAAVRQGLYYLVAFTGCITLTVGVFKLVDRIEHPHKYRNRKYRR